MGATTWDYFTPYDDDASAALQRLRAQVFREGRYERDGSSPEDVAPVQAKQMQKMAGESMLQWAARIQKLTDQLAGKTPKPAVAISSKPATIDELIEQQGESGTHSILDIQRVSDAPDLGVVSPMPAERLRQIFGTDRPTREMIESKQGDIDLIEDPLVCERWQGVYFTVYRNDKPDEIYFIGTSGD